MTDEASKHIAELDESDPAGWQVPGDCVRVMLHNPGGRPLVEERLREALAAARWTSRVAWFGIYPSSALTALWVLEFFPNAKRIGVGGKKIRDYSGLSRYRELTNLGIGDQKTPRDLTVLRGIKVEELGMTVKSDQDLEYMSAMQPVRFLGMDWPFDDFSAFRGPEVRFLHITGGKVTSLRNLKPELESLEIYNCRQLRDLSGASTELLKLDGCSKVDFQTLGGVRGLKFLSVFSMPSINTFEKIPELTSLLKLGVGAVKGLPDEVAPLVRSPSLRRVHLAHPTPSRYIERIAELSPRFIVSNGKKAFFRGKWVDPQEFYKVPLEGDHW